MKNKINPINHVSNLITESSRKKARQRIRRQLQPRREGQSRCDEHYLKLHPESKPKRFG